MVLTTKQIKRFTKKELVKITKEHDLGIKIKGINKLKKADLIAAMRKAPFWDCVVKTLVVKPKKVRTVKQKAAFSRMRGNITDQIREATALSSAPEKFKKSRLDEINSMKVRAIEDPTFLKLLKAKEGNRFGELFPELKTFEGLLNRRGGAAGVAGGSHGIRAARGPRARPRCAPPGCNR